MLIIKYVIAQRYARLYCNFGLQRYKKIMIFARKVVIFFVIRDDNLLFCSGGTSPSTKRMTQAAISSHRSIGDGLNCKCEKTICEYTQHY